MGGFNISGIHPGFSASELHRSICGEVYHDMWKASIQIVNSCTSSGFQVHVPILTSQGLFCCAGVVLAAQSACQNGRRS